MKKMILLAVLIAVAAGPARAEPTTIKMNWSVVPAHLHPLMPLVPKEIYRHWGKSYVLEPVRMRGAGASTTALAANAIQAVAASPQSLVNGVTRAKIDLVVFAQGMTSDMPGTDQGGTFWVRKDEIKRIEDLKGKTLAVTSRGGSIHGAIRAKLEEFGINADTECQIVEVRLPVQLDALKEKRIDMGFAILPFTYRARKDPTLKMLFTTEEVIGPAETVIYAAKRDWLEKNRAAVVDFLEDVMRFRRFLFDPKTRMQAIEIMSKFTKVPVRAFKSWAFTKKDNYREPHALVSAERLQKNVDFLKKARVVAETIDVKRHFDMSYAREAAARLNK